MDEAAASAHCTVVTLDEDGCVPAPLPRRALLLHEEEHALLTHLTEDLLRCNYTLPRQPPRLYRTHPHPHINLMTPRTYTRNKPPPHPLHHPPRNRPLQHKPRNIFPCQHPPHPLLYGTRRKVWSTQQGLSPAPHAVQHKRPCSCTSSAEHSHGKVPVSWSRSARQPLATSPAQNGR